MNIERRIFLGFLAILLIFFAFDVYLFKSGQTIDLELEYVDRLFEEETASRLTDLDATLHMVTTLGKVAPHVARISTGRAGRRSGICGPRLRILTPTMSN